MKPFNLEAAKQATPHDVLIAELMSPNTSKTEREHAAVREIEALRQALDQLPDTTEMIEPEFECPRCGHCCRQADVPDATKWVDELRGDDPSNSTTDVVGPEPVAWLWKNKDGHQVITDDPDYADGTWVPLYTAPPKHNADPIGEIVEAHGLTAVSIHEMPPVGTKLYAAPPEREWVGLTLEELHEISNSMLTWNSHDIMDTYVAIEAKLKEKNTSMGHAAIKKVKGDTHEEKTIA